MLQSLLRRGKSAREKEKTQCGDYNPSRLASGRSEWYEASQPFLYPSTVKEHRVHFAKNISTH